MTAGPTVDWIRARQPAPPVSLRARVEALAAGASLRAPPADALVEVAEVAMRDLLRAGCETRERALELLAIDAIVTYAFEAAADDVASLEARTHAALVRIAALAEPYRA